MILHRICRFICFVFFVTVLRMEVKGKKNIPRKGGFIVAGNHVSNLDPIGIGVACPRIMSYMGKKELFGNFFTKRFMLGINVFPVKRGEADFGAIREAFKRVKKGQGLLLFPEGGRQTDTSNAEVLPGVGFLAVKLGVPVIPAYIGGTVRAMPKGSKFIRPGKVTVIFGEEIPIERSAPYQDIARQIMDRIRQLSCQV